MSVSEGKCDHGIPSGSVCHYCDNDKETVIVHPNLIKPGTHCEHGVHYDRILPCALCDADARRMGGKSSVELAESLRPSVAKNQPKWEPPITHRIVPPTAEELAAAGDMLDRQPVPTEGRMHYNPETDRVEAIPAPSRPMPFTVLTDDEQAALAEEYGDPAEALADPVGWPTHYNQGDIECIDAMVSAFGREQVEIYCRLAAFKYLWRSDYKDGNKDLKKAIWYTRFATGDDPRKDGERT